MSFANYLILIVNNYCNLHCEYCVDQSHLPIDPDSEQLDRRNKWEMSLDDVRLFCEQFKGVHPRMKVSVSGGEPTALPIEKLHGIIDILHEYKRRIQIITNGFNVMGIDDAHLRKVSRFKLDDHGINHKHVQDCVKYLRNHPAFKGNVLVTHTEEHYDLKATRRHPANRGGHCGRQTMRSRLEITVYKNVVYPCCSLPFMELQDNSTKMREVLTGAGWVLWEHNLIPILQNWKETLPLYVMKMCGDCWWPEKHILGGIPITLKSNDVVKKG